MASTLLGLQTFTIRKFLKTPSSRAEAFRRLGEAGVKGIELARVKFTPPVINDIDTLRKEEGIDVLSTQIKLDVIKKDLNWTVEFHKQLDCTRCVVSVISFPPLLKGVEGLKAYAQDLNETGRKMKEQGIQLLFHHHNFEFVPLKGGRTAFSVLEEQLDKDLLSFVLDTYWLQRSGHDPAAFIRQMEGRVKGVHLRDMALCGKLWNPSIRDCELGEGNMNFKAILDACRDTGVEYAAIEQDAADPWNSLDLSLEHLKKLDVSGQ